jgi:mannose-1-phosphate guanylyltransferase
VTPPRALVLAAGLGTRLRPLTDVRAKAAVPVNGETLARRVIGWLASEGISELVVNLHHRPETLTASVGDGGDLGARVRYSWEQPVLGSAGGPRHALPLLGSRFLIVNADTLTDVETAALLAAHECSGARVTLALIPNPRPETYGGVRVSNDGWVTGFTRPGSGEASYHFIGVQAAEAEVFAALVDGVPYESVNALYPALIAASAKSIGAFICRASFQDIGTPSDYLATSIRLSGTEGDRLVSGRATVAESARVVRTAVWDDVSIGRGATLTECVVCDGARIPEGAHYERCVILRATGAAAERAASSAGARAAGDLLIWPI